MSMATQHFGIDLKVFMVKVSFNQKPYRKLMMNTWGADVYASPSEITAAGRAALAKNPNDSGSLGMAISEAVEMALQNPQDTRYCLGSVLNHVLLHQTIIGEEAVKQMELFGEYPDVVIGCFGGGSNFAGISFSFLRDNLTKGKNTRVIAVEPQSCPKLTRGEFQYDFGDVAGFTPLLPMYTLGHNFHPSDIHAGGLRYHGAGSIVSQLLKDKVIEAQSVPQTETLAAGVLFARTEGIIPAPESAHAIAQAIREAKRAKEEGVSKTILFNLSGHGQIDLYAYEQYFAGKLRDYEISDNEIRSTLNELEKLSNSATFSYQILTVAADEMFHPSLFHPRPVHSSTKNLYKELPSPQRLPVLPNAVRHPSFVENRPASRLVQAIRYASSTVQS